MSQIDSIKILGVRVDKVTWQTIENFCNEAFLHNLAKHIVTVNGEFILEAQNNSEFKNAINQADLVIPDSTNVMWASRYIHEPLPELTPGSELTIKLAKLAEKEKMSIFLLGAKEGIAKKASEALQKKFPKLIIAGTSCANPNADTVALVQKAKPDILLVAYPASIQVTWIADNINKLNAKIVVGVGGTFDMLAGILPRAPKFVRALHLEWVWRFILQPSRLPRIWNALVVFPIKILTQ